MSELTCVVIGGGFAGIHAVKSIWKSLRQLKDDRKLRLILLDKQPHHVRKVLLFRSAIDIKPITIPWEKILPEGIQVRQGSLYKMDDENKCVTYRDAEGQEQHIAYDILVIAAGSVVRTPEADQGGIALTDLKSAECIRIQWKNNLQLALTESNVTEKERLMSAAIVGAGITGIETASELAFAIRSEAAAIGLDPAAVKVHLLNKHHRLFNEGPAKVSHALERLLMKNGITVHHRCEAVREEQGRLLTSEGATINVGLTVWTLGLIPNSELGSLNLPLRNDGKIQVDECYRVRGMDSVYSIGDCAHIVEPITGKADGMTCKEAIPQGQRLGSIIYADLTGIKAPTHKGVMEFYNIGLGPENGLMWTRKWGLDMIITGKLAYKMKAYLWDVSSMLRG